MICIFNPEHDLCLANGNANYLPPRSALDFADGCKEIMQLIYGTEATCLCARQLVADVPGECMASHLGDDIVAWGWNATLRQQLAKAGWDETSLPTLQRLEHLRHLQHRATAQKCLAWMSQQTGSPYPAFAVTAEEQLEPLLEQYARLVLKVPLSGSGRGLIWIDGNEWQANEAKRNAQLNIVRKTIAWQGCVMAEPWLDIVLELAMEFHVADTVDFVGYSLFSSKAGVYDGNLLLPDNEIAQRVGQHIPVAQLQHTRLLLTYWIANNIRPHYQGPMGVDMLIHGSPRGPRLRPVSEINMRHTMGLVAHKYLETHPEDRGKRFLIKHDAQGYHWQVQ